MVLMEILNAIIVLFHYKITYSKVSKFVINIGFPTTILIGFNYLCIYLKIKDIPSLVPSASYSSSYYTYSVFSLI